MQAVRREWGMGPALHGRAVSSALWGAVLVGLSGGVPCNRLDRKTTLFWMVETKGRTLEEISAQLSRR